MYVVAHRGNRLHAPENTKTALISAYTAGADVLEFDVQLSADGRLVVSHDPTLERVAGDTRPIIETNLSELRALDVSATFRPRGAAETYRYKREGRAPVRVETLPELLDELPRGVPKLLEIKHDSTLTTGRRDELVEKVVKALTSRGLEDEVVLYSKDPDNLKLARRLAPTLRICTFDWELSPEDQIAQIAAHGADGAVVELGTLLGPDGNLTDAGRRFADLHRERDLRVGAVIYILREPRVPTQAEYEALRVHDFVWSIATDSMLDVAGFTRRGGKWFEEPFAGTTMNERRFALGYAKANKYARVYHDDGIHVDIADYHGPSDASEVEERLWDVAKTWPFYSGGGVGLKTGIDGAFAAEVDYEVSRVGQASTLEMAVVNADPGAHQAEPPRSFRDKDVFFDPHGAPPFAGVEHDEDDGYRINYNLGVDYDNNQYTSPVGDGTARAGRLRLERRGPFFSAYYRNEHEAPDWVCVGVARNDSLNERVYLRCAGKRWRQERDDDPSQYHPVVAVDFTFRNLRIDRFR